MKIFISWYGQRSRAVASALREFIPLIFQRAQVFTTIDNDIERGSKWNTEIISYISTADVAVICLTPESLNSPWLTFEAGALSSSIGANKVFPLLIGLSLVDLVGPFTQFQVTSLEKSDIFSLFKMLNKNYDLGLSDSILNQLFETMWPRFESQIKAISSQEEYKSIYNDSSLKTDSERLKAIMAEIENLKVKIEETVDEFVETSSILKAEQDEKALKDEASLDNKLDTVIVPIGRSYDFVIQNTMYQCPALRTFKNGLKYIAFYMDKKIIGYGEIEDKYPIIKDNEWLFKLKSINELNIPHLSKGAFVQNKLYCNKTNLVSAKDTSEIRPDN
jgi:hypothetical protein